MDKINLVKQKEIFMFCKNCGNELKEDETYCSVCGFARGQGNRFCPNCGKEITQGASFCGFCGQKVSDQPTDQTVYNNASNNQNNNTNTGTKKGKSRLAAGLLQIFLGSLGIGRFYLGYSSIGVYQILVSVFTCGIGGIWGLIDGILILTGYVDKDADGNPLVD